MMSMKKRLAVLLVGLMLIAFLLATGLGCEPAAEPPEEGEGKEEEVVIGAVLPLSGPLSITGMSHMRGYEMFFEHLNEKGGLQIGDKTYKFKFLVEDSKMSAEGGDAAGRKLVHQDGAVFIFGPIMEDATMAVGRITEEAGVAYFVEVNTPGHPADISVDKPFTARITACKDVTNTSNFDFLVENYPDVKKIAITAANIGNEFMIDDAGYVAENRGLEVVGAEQFDMGTEDFIPFMTKVVAFKPDAIYAIVSGQAPYQLMAARQLGFTGPFLSTAPTGPDVFCDVVGEPDHLTDVITNGINPFDATPEMEKVFRLWEEKYDEPLVTTCAMSWDKAWILVQAMEKAQSVDPQDVLDALDSMTNPGDIKTIFGDGYMFGEDRYGLNRALQRPIPITRIMDAEIETVGYFLGTHR